MNGADARPICPHRPPASHFVRRAEGYTVILVNSNPATIMTDPGTADRTYVGPMTPELVEQILEKERPDAILPTMGGQTALNLAKALSEVRGHALLQKEGSCAAARGARVGAARKLAPSRQPTAGMLLSHRCCVDNNSQLTRCANQSSSALPSITLRRLAAAPTAERHS